MEVLVTGGTGTLGRATVPLLIAADLGRALALASVPLAAWLGVLGMAQLYLVAMITSALSILFEVAYRAYLPALVGRDELVKAVEPLFPEMPDQDPDLDPDPDPDADPDPNADRPQPQVD